MLKKETLIKSFSEEDINEALKIYEKYKLAYEKDIPIFTNNFHSPNIWSFFEGNCNNSNFVVETNGLFEESERRIIAFNNYYKTNYPIKILRISNKSNFSNLKHKDYLGSILSLGIGRDKLGDIIVKEDKAYIPVLEDISDFILNNLSHIGKSPIEIKVIEDNNELPSAQFEEIFINVSSLRADSIVAKISNVSRSKAIEIIESGKVLIDYVKARDKSQEISKDTRVTIRGIGKFIIGEIIGETRSGKQRIVVKKYI
ncbi:YlmH/Sll1252 family protein [Clostridium sp. C8]|uniref:RNA-binding S4 domain-containing protein n=1 Tax=bioreactor metagenome TaxID=1076179 RepID=A0A644W6V8_9ZZZZ|nr:YlmH/Sll1252 family protein [Clostridium sp. C8]KLE16746.1 RNA-binding protein S4 [Clostridium sp. C8]